MLRKYDPERDKAATHRIWREAGWLEEGKEEAMDRFVAGGKAWVAEIEGEAECLVLMAPGDMRYLDETLPFAAVSGVTTSRVARKQGLAGRLAAMAIAEDAQEGALLSGLGMFEQGFYNKLGFGSGGYEFTLTFDPGTLLVKTKPRPPKRLTKADAARMHRARQTRLRSHGGVCLYPEILTGFETDLASDGFGLGYTDTSDGELSHFLWLNGKNEHGPYSVEWMVYHNRDEFLELMALLHNLGDQVHRVRMGEPAGIQMQDLLELPLRQRSTTAKAEHPVGIRSIAYWQMRICDLAGCLRQTHLSGNSLRFQLTLTDPIEKYLDTSSAWRGTGGEYVVTLGPESQAERGTDASLPVLSASVNAFTRMWLGVRPASGLSITDDLRGPDTLLAALDRLLRLPDPRPDWDF